MADGMTAEAPDTRLAVSDLVRMFEESEKATEEARREAALDRDYYDGKQIDEEVRKALRERRQPETIANRVKPKIDFYLGLEVQQRQAPKALPRTPLHEQDAGSVSDALRFVIESESYYQTRSHAWRDMVREGIGAVEIALEQRPYREMTEFGPIVRQEMCITFRQVPWDRFFYDPASSRDDFEDAGYLGVVKWMDYAEALNAYPDQAELLTDTMNAHSSSDTYDDKPRWSHWIDPKRKRVRVCQIWLKRADRWFWVEFTKTGVLKGGPSPFQDENGNSLCGLLAACAHTDRDNNRYGVIRSLRPLQDEFNKLRSKILHLISTAQIVMEQGAVADIEKARLEAARPDGVIEVLPGSKFEFNTRSDIAQAHMALLAQVGNEIDLMGPNASMLGQEGDVASGRAILASQQGGMVQIADLLDKLRYLDKRIYRVVWAAIRQYWTAPKWVRVTDDDSNVRFVGLNQPGQTPVAALDVDIILDDSMASLTPALEQFHALTNLAQAGVPIPPDVIIEAAPNLRNKGKILERLQAAMQMAQQPAGPDPMEAKMAETRLSLEAKQTEREMDLAFKQREGEQRLAFMQEETRVKLDAKKLEAVVNAEIAASRAVPTDYGMQ